MNRILTTTAALLATAALATTAHAGDMKMKSADMQMNAPAQSRTTVMVKTIDADNQVGQMQVMASTPRKTAVLGALAVQKTDAYVVEAPDGEIYLNHLLSVSELPDPTLSVREVQTYTTEYRGMTFTNRVVSE